LIFLPPYSSYILQPFNLSCFLPLKLRYRSQIAALVVLNDLALVKKQRFIRCYNLARTESLTERVIRSGWKVVGIYLWNLSKALTSS
ncbi:DDE-domain-containing protein, partial [Lepidopterella palustris CBS 459.81]